MNINRIALFSSILITSTVFLGCENRSAQAADIQKIQKRLESLENELPQVKTELESLKVETSALKSQAQLAEILEKLKNVAYLTPGADGYSIVTYDLGSLTMQLDDVKPYANGSKVTLKIGNPMFTSINGLKMKIEWGKVDANGTPDNNNLKSKALTLSQVIQAGKWNAVPFVLDGVAPQELGFVRVSEISHTGINLQR